MRVYRIATVYLDIVGRVTIFGGIDLGVINILVYGEASAGLQNSDRFLGHCWMCYRFWVEST